MVTGAKLDAVGDSDAMADTPDTQVTDGGPTYLGPAGTPYAEHVLAGEA